MNCLQFRRALETDPNAIDEAHRAHARICESCAEFARRVAHFSRRLEAAVNSPVPENLSDKILLKHSFRERSAWRWRWPTRAVALAAAMALVISAALAVFGYLHHESQIENEVIAMVNAADYALESTAPISDETISTALEPVGLSLDGGISNVSFAGRCLVQGRLSGHVVLRDHGTPISVFLVPGENIIRQTKFDGPTWSGILVPAEHGAIAIVAPHGQPLDGALQQMLRTVRWPV